MSNIDLAEHIRLSFGNKHATISQLREEYAHLDRLIDTIENKRRQCIHEQGKIGDSTKSEWQELDERIFQIWTDRNDLVRQLRVVAEKIRALGYDK